MRPFHSLTVCEAGTRKPVLSQMRQKSPCRSFCLLISLTCCDLRASMRTVEKLGRPVMLKNAIATAAALYVSVSLITLTLWFAFGPDVVLWPH